MLPGTHHGPQCPVEIALITEHQHRDDGGRNQQGAFDGIRLDKWKSNDQGQNQQQIGERAVPSVNCDSSQKANACENP
jgi:hypothetical protein